MDDSSGVTERLNDIELINPQRGWAVEDSGMILATADGGASWEPQTSNTTASLHSVGFVDAQRGWAVGPRLTSG